jgi:hypothetical protein
MAAVPVAAAAAADDDDAGGATTGERAAECERALWGEGAAWWGLTAKCSWAEGRVGVLRGVLVNVLTHA